MKLKNTIHFLLLLFLFFLPWQTRWIYQPAFLNGGFWEYGTSSFYATEILLWIIIIFFAIDRFGNKLFWKKVTSPEHFKIHKKFIFYYLVGLLLFASSIFLSLNPEISFNLVFHILEGACLLIVLVLINQSTNKLIISFWLGAVVQGMLAIWQFFSQIISPNKWLGLAAHSPSLLSGDFVVETASGRWLRAYGAFGSPNILGAFLAVAFLMGILLMMQTKTARVRLAIAIGQIVIFAGLIFSFSRGSWLALVVGLTVLGVLLWRAPTSYTVYQKTCWRWNVTIAVLTATAMVFVYGPLFMARTGVIGRLEAQSMNERAAQYQTWLSAVDSPRTLLIGLGPGAYTQALWHLDKWHPAWFYQPIHNSYLLVLAEFGCLGLAFLFWLHILLWRQIKKINPLFLSVIVVVLVSALFDHFWWSLYAGQIMWFTVWGLGLSTLDTMPASGTMIEPFK